MPSTPQKSSEWHLLVAAILIVATAAFIIEYLFNSSIVHHNVEYHLAQVASQANRLSVIEYQVMVKQKWSPDQIEEMEEADAALKEHLAALPLLADEDASLGLFRSVVSKYEQDVRTLFELYRIGQFAAAAQWDETQVDPMYESVLKTQKQAMAITAERAQAWHERAHTGMVITVLVSALLASLLFLRYERARRRAARLEAEQRTLGESERRLTALIQNGSDVFAVLDGESIFHYLTPASERVLGHSPAALIGTSAMDLVHGDDRPAAEDLLRQASAEPGTNRTAELRLRQGDGTWGDYEVIGCDMLSVPEVGGVVFTYRNITERKAAARELTRMAFQDMLTGLPNRALFMERLTRSLAAADRPNSVAVLFIDLDNFKLINDSLGHETGDRLLAAVTERLQKCLQPQHVLARLGGDEFTVLLENTAVGEALRFAQELRQQMVPPFRIQGQEFFMSASIGVAVNDDGEWQAEYLLRNADLAMYEAKRCGKAREIAFDREMREQVDQRLAMETDLRRAIERDELRLFYQPIVHLSSRQIIGVEALMRWEHPVRGLIAPSDFISLAEEMGLIVDLGRWALNEACRQARAWQTSGPADQPALRMSVNLSALQLQHPQLVQEVAQALGESGLEPGCLELELTESALMRDMDRSVAVLRALRALGVRTAVDDFGTGYSSLAYLQRFPLNTLKIDRSFTQQAGTDPKMTAIMGAVVQMGCDLGLDVVCEGIEEEEQMVHLRGIGCPLGQGYHFARPLPPDACGEFLHGGAVRQ